MTLRSRLSAVVLLSALMAAVVAMPAVATEDETDPGFETVLRGTNDYRELNGKDRLVHDPRMSAVAQAWAERMASDFANDPNEDRDAALDDAFRHNPNMSTQVPSGWESVGENIAVNGGYADSYAYLLTQWRNSSGHKANMLNSRWTHIGVGVYQDDSGLTWGVQVFGDYGSPASIPDPGTAVIDLDTIPYSGTVDCVALVNEPSGSEFFRQCGTRAGNQYTFSDVPPGLYSVTLRTSVGDVLYSGWPSRDGTFTVLPGGGVVETVDSVVLSGPAEYVLGQRTYMDVVVDPAVSGTATLSYRRPGGGWSTSSQVVSVTDGHGTASIGGSGGVWELRVTFNGVTSNTITMAQAP